MSYKTLMVHVEPRRGETRLRVCVDLAARLQAHLVGVGAVGFDVIPDMGMGYSSAPAVALVRDQIDADLEKAEKVFRQAAATAPTVKTTWRSDVDLPTRALTKYARCADLVIATRDDGHDYLTFASPSDLVMSVATPVLMLPPGLERVETGTVMVAWKNSIEARRALWDALPILQIADRVVVVGVEEDAEQQELDAELRDIAERLSRHGVAADTELLPRLSLTMAEQLEAAADNWRADLIVAGAYGHSRLREWIFGGVTRGLMRESDRPVLFSR